MKKWPTSLRRLIFLASTAISAVLKTVTGAIIHITDALAKPVQALSIALEPIQDLHGYDNPWPAGGGKNKFDSSLMADAGTGAKFITLNLKPNTAYTMSSDDSCKDNGTITDLFFCNMDESVSSGTNGVKLNRSVTRTSDANGQLRVGYRCYESWITPEQLVAYHTQVEEGSIPTSWTPYSNICPISGFTGLNVYGTGVNVWDEEWELGYLDPSTGRNASSNDCIRAKNYSAILPNTSYYVKVPSGSGVNCKLFFYDADKAFISWTTKSNEEYTTPSNARYFRFFMANQYGATYNNDISINYPSTVTSYSPYVGTTLPVSWQSEAGTVYAGFLSIDKDGNCTLTGTHKIKDLGDFTYGYNVSQKRFFSNNHKTIFTDCKYVNGWDLSEYLCEIYKVSSVQPNGTTSGIIGVYQTQVYIRDYNYEDANDLRTMLTGHKLFYPLATPVTYTLTPVTAPSTVQGENNWWHDANGNITMTYLADGNASEIEALNILLGGRYVNNHTADEPTDREALDILLGGTR